MPYTDVTNDVIIWHENDIEFNIRISACMPYCCNNRPFDPFNIKSVSPYKQL